MEKNLWESNMQQSLQILPSIQAFRLLLYFMVWNSMLFSRLLHWRNNYKYFLICNVDHTFIWILSCMVFSSRVNSHPTFFSQTSLFVTETVPTERPDLSCRFVLIFIKSYVECNKYTTRRWRHHWKMFISILKLFKRPFHRIWLDGMSLYLMYPWRVHQFLA